MASGFALLRSMQLWLRGLSDPDLIAAEMLPAANQAAMGNVCRHVVKQKDGKGVYDNFAARDDVCPE